MRSLYGILSTSEHYNRHMVEALADLSGYCTEVDDIIIYDSTIEDHITHISEFLYSCVEKKIALKPQKCIFSVIEVTFAGFMPS